MESAKGGNQIVVLILALAVFAGLGVVHRGALLLSEKLFPRPVERERNPQEEMLRALLP